MFRVAVKKICLCGCGRQAVIRGLCLPGYQRLRAQVESRQTTWFKLVQQGLAAPRNRRYRSQYSR